MNQAEPIFQSLHSKIQTAIDHGDIQQLKNMCDQYLQHDEIILHSCFHQNTFNVCIQLGRYDMLVELQAYTNHQFFTDWRAYMCMDIAKQGSISMMKLALSQGAHIYPQTVKMAAKHNNFELLKYLLTEQFHFDELSANVQFDTIYYAILDIIHDHTGQMFQWCWDKGYRLVHREDTLEELLDVVAHHIKINSTAPNETWWRKFLLQLQHVTSFNHKLYKLQQRAKDFELYLTTVSKCLHQLLRPTELIKFIPQFI